MIDASDRYRNAIRSSHLAVVDVTAWRRRTDGSRVSLGKLDVIDGSFTVDGSRTVWRSLNIRLANVTVGSTGQTAAEVLNPADTEVTVSFGVQLDWAWEGGGPDWEAVKVADLRVTRVRKERGAAVIDLDAVDHGDRVSDMQLNAPWPTAMDENGMTNPIYESRNTVAAIQALVAMAYPTGWTLQWTVDPAVDTAAAFPKDRTFTGDRWTAITDLAKTLRAWVHNDADGRWVIEPLPALGTPALTLDEGADGTLSSVTLDDDRMETWSAVALTCEDPQLGSLSVLVPDNDPGSPTYYEGPFGKRVYGASNDLAAGGATDEATAVENVKAVAAGMLGQLRGRGRKIECSALYDPTLEPGDTIEVRMPDGSLASHVVDTVTLPIPAGTMRVSTRLLEVSVGGSPPIPTAGSGS